VAASRPTVVTVGGRELKLTNLDKVLYPASDLGPAFTKAEVIDYHARIAPTILPHLAGRCITFLRFPDGADQPGFFEKRCPKHRPDWVRTAIGPGDRGGDIGYCRLDEPASLVWSANLAALELHVPMALAADLESPRAVVFGGAGTGKTVLACEKARQLTDEGNTVLLTCFNEFLARRLSADKSLEHVTIATFHSLCISTARSAGLEVPTSPESKWRISDAPILLMEGAEATGLNFDAVVVDEGQDFSRLC